MSEYYTNECAPIKCVHCECTRIKVKVKDSIEGIVCEEEYTCRNCGTCIGYWAYGLFDPSFIPEFTEKIKEKIKEVSL